MNEKKPIYLFVTPFFPRPESWRGAFCYDFVKALMRQQKYDVRVFVHWRKGEGTLDDYEYHGIKVHRFRYRRAPFGIAPFLFSRWNRKSFQKKVDDVGIEWKDVAVYHAHELLFADYLSDIRKAYPQIKTVLHFHSGPQIHLKTGRLGIIPVHATFLYFYYRRLLQSVDIPVFVSQTQKRYFGKWYADGYLRPPVDIRNNLLLGKFLPKMGIKPSIVCYNGIDYSVFNANARSESAQNRGSSLVIGCVGNFTVEKDQITLLKAIKILKDRFPQICGLKCIFIGSGDKLSECRQYANANDLSGIVNFKTEIDHLELPGFYRSLDLFVLPSWIEGFGCSYIEAYGCGTPIMGCKGVSVEEAIPMEERERWLFQPQNAEELASKIYDYYLHRYKQRLVQDFDIDSLVGEFVSRLQIIGVK